MKQAANLLLLDRLIRDELERGMKHISETELGGITGVCTVNLYIGRTHPLRKTQRLGYNMLTPISSVWNQAQTIN